MSINPHYLQIRNYVHQSVPSFPSLPEEGPIFTLLSSPTSKELVSSFVNAFSEYLSLVCKLEMMCGINSYSINETHQLIQFKVLHRLHYWKTKFLLQVQYVIGVNLAAVESFVLFVCFALTVVLSVLFFLLFLISKILINVT